MASHIRPVGWKLCGTVVKLIGNGCVCKREFLNFYLPVIILWSDVDDDDEDEEDDAEEDFEEIMREKPGHDEGPTARDIEGIRRRRDILGYHQHNS